MKMLSKIKIKRILQVLLFAVLPNLDLIRNVGDGDKRMLTIHGIGLVVAGVIILHYGIKSFLRVYNLAWVALGAFFMWVVTTAYHYFPYTGYYKNECQLMCISLSLFGMIYTKMLIDLIKERKKISDKLKNFFCKRNLPFFFWFGYIVIATLGKEHFYRPAFDLIYFLPLFLASFRKEEMKALYEDMSNGIIACFWIIQWYAYFHRPWVDDMIRYRGMYYNSNIYCMMCLIILLLILVKMTKTRRKKTIKNWLYWFWAIQYGMVFSLIVLSGGRISIFLAVVVTVLYAMVVFYALDRERVKKLFYTSVLFGLIICIMFPITYACVSYIPRIKKDPVGFQSDYLMWGDLYNPETYVSPQEFLESSMGRIYTLFFDFQDIEKTVRSHRHVSENMSIQRSDGRPMDPEYTEDKIYYLDDESYNSFELRFAIGMTYFSRLNMSGHTVDYWELWISPYYWQYHAHNIFIMEAYVYGIPAGIFFILWTIALGVIGIQFMKKNKSTLYSIFPFFAMLLVIGFGMFDMSWQPGHLSWFLLLIATKFLMKCADEKCEIGKNKAENV